MYKHLYRSFLASDPKRLHFAAHSHYLWPDVSREAQLQYWDDSARLADQKWDYIFSEVIPDVQRRIAKIIGVSAPDQLCFAPNTHEFINRLLSCFSKTKLKILTTDSEFHSFSRQIARLEEEQLVQVERVACVPFENFSERFQTACAKDDYDLVFLSHVFFNSGYVIQFLENVLSTVIASNAMIVVDGYHSFMALPFSLAKLEQRIFFLAGGYKYAQAGEGACFMHVPSDYSFRPKNTGWYASFAALTAQDQSVSYASNGQAFWGATFDPSGLYRLRAVLKLYQSLDLTIETVDNYAKGLQSYFIKQLDGTTGLLINSAQLVVKDPTQRGHFISFESEQASDIYRKLKANNVITDVRGNYLRFGFGLYQDKGDIDRLIEYLKV